MDDLDAKGYFKDNHAFEDKMWGLFILALVFYTAFEKEDSQ